MTTHLLLTSFQTWKPEQPSNSSDDLLVLAAERHLLPPAVTTLRQLPVDTAAATAQVIPQIRALQPRVVVCCGMAEKASALAVESQAVIGESTLKTRLDLHGLVEGLDYTTISHDAGRFVCNAVYHAVLQYVYHALPLHLEQQQPARQPAVQPNSHHRSHPRTHGLFVHVPVLTAANRERVLGDFGTLLQRLGQ